MKIKVRVLNQNKSDKIRVIFQNSEYTIADAYESCVGKICLSLEDESNNTKLANLEEVVLIDENQIDQLEKFLVSKITNINTLDLEPVPKTNTSV